MRAKDTMVLGEDFYSLAFYGYYKQPDDQILDIMEQDSINIKKLETIMAAQIN
jgi:hypothetical protein